MPELPDIELYLGALSSRVVGQPLLRVRIASPFLLRTVEPPLSSVEGQTVRQLRRIGKRIAFGFDNELWLVLHLMIAGRLHWRPRNAKLAGKQNLAAFDFPRGSLVLTEAGAKRRHRSMSSRDEAALEALDPGGIDVFASDLNRFAPRSRPRTTRSNARSPIRASSAASATPTPTRFCTPRSFRRSR